MKGVVIVGMRLEKLNELSDVYLWGAKGLRVMIENVITSFGVQKDELSEDLETALNDVLIKAQDLEERLHQLSDPGYTRGSAESAENQQSCVAA